jgi:hypothetical protein
MESLLSRHESKKLTLEYKKTDRELTLLEYKRYKKGQIDNKDEDRGLKLKIRMQEIEQKMKELKITNKTSSKYGKTDF